MPKYTIQFETTIRGEVTVEAKDEDHAYEIGEEMAQDTLNYEELTDGGECAPDVETECENVYQKPEAA